MSAAFHLGFIWQQVLAHERLTRHFLGKLSLEVKEPLRGERAQPPG